MSHEIRTPLNAVLGMAHLALSASSEPRVKDYVSKILRSGQHLMGVLNDILDFSKIDAGKMVIEHTNINIGQIFRETSDMIAERCASKGLELIVDLPSDVPKVIVGDSLRLKQILINYLNNAVKFTEKGRVVMAVRVLSRAENRALVRFEVRDTGIGIDEVQKKQLFRSFQQGDSSTTRRFGGTGLGLVIAKRLVEAMGGRVGLESELGVGSTFWFEVEPNVVEGGAEMSGTADRRFGIDTAAKSAPQNEVAKIALRGRRALVVEDNELNQEVACELLKEVGLEVDVAANGAEALDRLQEQPQYDVVLMDVQMPIMDGLEATRRLRQDPRFGNLPILAMTASAMQHDQEECLAVGMNDFISKPVDPATLVKVLLKWLPAGGSPGPDAREPASAPNAAADNAGENGFPDIPGIDTSLGLSYAMGKPNFYRKLLVRFRDEHAAVFADQFAQAWKAGDHSSAVRLAHTLKGLSRGIGAGELGQVLEDLEKAAKAGDASEVARLF